MKDFIRYMNRFHRYMILLICLLLWGCRTKNIKQKSGEKNVLLIIIDDLRPELGCYGNLLIKTPKIDSLASHSMIFTNAHAQQAVCAASRASFLTGCRPDVTGSDYPYSEYFVEKFMPAHATLQRYFYEHGYYTVTAGKVHHGGPGDKVGKELSEPHCSIDSLKFYALPENIALGGKRGRSAETPPWEMADVSDHDYKDGAMALEVMNMIDRGIASEKPLFIAVGFHKPHLPFAAPKKYWDLYAEDSIPLSPNPYKPEGVKAYSLAHYELKSYKGEYNKNGEPVPDSVARKLVHGYYACVSYIDAQVGKLVDKLKSEGLYDNTVIILMSDHGYHLGDQNNWCKHTNFDRSTHSPLVIKPASRKVKANRCDALVEYVDIYPTLMDLTSQPKSGYLEGVSLVPLMDSPLRPWKSAVFSQYPREYLNLEGYAIRTAQYRYVEWRDITTGEIDSRELYDHEVDPLESENLAGNQHYKKIITELQKQLNNGWKYALPEGISNNSNNAIAPPPVPWK